MVQVSGGWSEWSEWRPCNPTKALYGTGQCLCSMRKCINPIPQNNGKDCEGLSEMVTIELIEF